VRRVPKEVPRRSHAHVCVWWCAATHHTERERERARASEHANAPDAQKAAFAATNLCSFESDESPSTPVSLVCTVVPASVRRRRRRRRGHHPAVLPAQVQTQRSSFASSRPRRLLRQPLTGALRRPPGATRSSSVVPFAQRGSRVGTDDISPKEG